MSRATLEQRISDLYRQESRRILATLIRLLGDFHLAEEAMHEAFAAALAQWPDSGVPAQPRAWLISAGRFKAIDNLRKGQRLQPLSDDNLAPGYHSGERIEDIADDQLRLIFTCCHPSLSEDTRIAMTLREVCGLTTEQVAKALLQKPATIAQRIVRAKRKIRAAGIPYEVPERHQLEQRLATVLQVIYLIFNEGYSASSGGHLIDNALLERAILITRELAQLLDHIEIKGLLALLLLQASRRDTRFANGRLVTLEQQDRSRWRHADIDEADGILREILPHPEIGTYTLQAAIAALHATAKTADETDWQEILGFYDLLLQRHGTAVIALNRAVAVAMWRGPEQGLAALQALMQDAVNHAELKDYYLYHACQADLLARLSRSEQAARAYQQAIDLCPNAVERAHLLEQLAHL